MCDGSQVAQCSERRSLSSNVIEAVQGAYNARADIARAVNNNGNPADIEKFLAERHAAQCKAIRALNEHRKEHGC